MKPHRLLAETRLPSGAALTLHEHDGSYCVRLAGRELMHSQAAFSELTLGEVGTARLAAGKPARAPVKTSIPDEFGVSDRVRCWAREKGFTQIDAHLESFVRKCRAKNYKNVSWDDAFMEAIREDWAKLRGGSANGIAPPPKVRGFVQ